MHRCIFLFVRENSLSLIRLCVHEKVTLFRATLISGSSSSVVALMWSQADCKCSLSYQQSLSVPRAVSAQQTGSEGPISQWLLPRSLSVSQKPALSSAAYWRSGYAVSCLSPLLFASTATCQFFLKPSMETRLKCYSIQGAILSWQQLHLFWCYFFQRVLLCTEAHALMSLKQICGWHPHYCWRHL